MEKYFFKKSKGKINNIVRHIRFLERMINISKVKRKAHRSDFKRVRILEEIKAYRKIQLRCIIT